MIDKPVHIIFDLDGTLVDSKYEIINTYKIVFKEITPPSVINYDELNYGATLTAILNTVYNHNEELVIKAKKLFSEIYDNSDYEKTTLYQDVFETLNKIHEYGYLLHIATNKRYIPTIKILKSKKILNLFKSVITVDCLENKQLSKAEMVKFICETQLVSKGFMIGDSFYDIEAGKLAKLDTIAVLYGYEKKEELLRNNPKFVINQFKELNTIIFK